MGIEQDMVQAISEAGPEASWLALRDLRVRLARGETTGDRLTDFLFVEMRTLEEIESRRDWIVSVLEQMSKHVGEEMLIMNESYGFMEHSYVLGPFGRYEFKNFQLARILEGDYKVKMEVVGPRDTLKVARAELLLSAVGYSQLSTGFDYRPELFVEGPIEFSGHADLLVIGRKKILTWRRESTGNENTYQELHKALKAGISSGEEAPIMS